LQRDGEKRRKIRGEPEGKYNEVKDKTHFTWKMKKIVGF